ncbi:cryptochrome/photolyase family protein [Terasakiella sp.]|uniref:cryptochrome/photolyase family protein n=1 Tax=Terasakiella sp. TaxID=2034861 RepID=UPI003AA86D86
MNEVNIVWFRQDLRLADHPALQYAAQRGMVLPIYILDDEAAAPWKMGAASRVWLHSALQDLNDQLDGCLQVFQGNAAEILAQLIADYDVKGLYWGRCYEPWRMARDCTIKERFRQQGVDVRSFNHSLLWEPWEIQKKDGTPYKVFTPYFRKGCLNAPPPRLPLPAQDTLSLVQKREGLVLDDLSLLPRKIDWYSDMVAHWDISEEGAHNRLDAFLCDGLSHYKTGRDCPAQDNTSRLAPYLHFGQISPHQVWAAARSYGQVHHLDRDLDHFCSELAWREFSHSLLYYNSHIPEKPLQEKFNDFPWLENAQHVSAWQTGKTGYPIIDAGMRELWQTGYMHNRVRMIVASFLIKNLMIPWQDGEAWFWDCLFDADLANNSASWQWVAGCGADAAPYFRIFNPVTQSEKFDPSGDYIRRYVPELANLPDKYIHKPWMAPMDILKKYSIVLDDQYPRPIVDLKSTRERALAAFKELGR